MSASAPAFGKLLQPLQFLKGVGPNYAKILVKLNGERVIDLLWHAPAHIIDRRQMPAIADLESYHGQIVTIRGVVREHQLPTRRGLPVRIILADAGGALALVFFGGRPHIWQKALPIGSQKIISGKVEFYGQLAQIVHPDYILHPADLPKLAAIEPLYPLTQGLSNKALRKIQLAALAQVPDLPEWIDTTMRQQQAWPNWRQAMRDLHHPQIAADLSVRGKTRMRLAYDEILAHQLAMGLHHLRQEKNFIISRPPIIRQLQEKFIHMLPFALTAGQNQAIADINADMTRAQPMLRLLQGDVGSGKTVVAMAMLINACERGQQAALMAPTEILARQHALTLAPWAAGLGLRLGILTGRDKGKAKQKILADLADGNIDILIGTHALIQDSVRFARLGAVVIDEQHRFGVEQRLRLMQKSGMPDLLVMTATPIPRSLYLAIYGDLATTRLLEKPPGRQPITTRSIALDRLDEVVEGLKRAIAAGAQAYWVCPLIAETEDSDLAAAEARFAELSAHFPGIIGLLHGRMRAKAKDAMMQQFTAGTIKLLISTTVIEVGVHVPDATIMVIDHAERFGLSQLHQLRGRVGRSDKPSSCLLLFAPNLSPTAQARIGIMRESEDGFRLAEEDLKLRGAGEILGKKQSGWPEMKIADFLQHQDLFQMAQRDAQHILHQDPYLLSARGKNLRLLLELFNRNEASLYVQSG
jgi:ATP-dependent DNA helicase RecG